MQLSTLSSMQCSHDDVKYPKPKTEFSSTYQHRGHNLHILLTSHKKSNSMADFNPTHYLQHEWSDANSNWGKACAFLFYLYIWFQMIWSIEMVIAPKFGWDCYYQGLSDYAAGLWVMFLRALNVMQFGFFVYAHREGIEVWNVSMVFVFNALLTWVQSIPDLSNLDGTPPACNWDDMWTVIWVCFGWTVLFLLCSILENASKPQGTASETAPMVK